MAHVIERKLYQDIPATFATADALAGKRLDRRKNYGTPGPSKHEGTDVPEVYPYENVWAILAPDPLPQLNRIPKTQREYTNRAPRRGKFKPRKRVSR